jgi:large subunit ribosomal protein L22
MIYTNEQKNVGDSPRKLRLVADMVRKMTPDQAVEILSFTNKAAAPALAKAIKTAVANAGSKEGLSFEKIEINEGTKMRRYRVGTAGRGRGRAYKRRLSHIKIVLTDEVKGESK